MVCASSHLPIYNASPSEPDTNAPLRPGDADGQGEVRKKELQDSVVRLGLRSSADAFLVDDPTRFQDSMTKTWSKDDIADVLSSAFAPQTVTHPPPATPSSTPKGSQKSNAKSSKTETSKRLTVEDDEPPRCTIDVMITFDAHGVSAHPNHKSLFHGAKTFLGRIMKGKSGYACPLDLYTLHSTSVARKYISGLDTPITMVAGAIAAARSNMFENNKGANAWGKGPLRLLYVNGVSDYIKGAGAMTQCHGSQMRWFRWGWVAIGRYMVVNDLRRERVPASMPDERRLEREEVEEGGRKEGKGKKEW